MTKIAAMTRVTPKPGAFGDLCACAEKMSAATKEEDGTEVYFVARSTREPEVLWLFELFTDLASYKAHAAHGGAVSEMIAPFVASAEVVRGEPLAAKGLSL